MLQRLEFHAMGCEMLALVDSDTPSTQLEQVPVWFEEWEQVLSRFRYDSELSRLNQIHERPVHVSEILWQVLKAARRADRLTGGLVTATLLDAITRAGYDRPFDEMQADSWIIPPTPAKDVLLPLSSLKFNTRARTVTLPRGVGLDFGGIAKGWAAHQAARRLQTDGPALVDAGGDIAISGPRIGNSAWDVGVASPFDPQKDIEVLHLRTYSVATSGRDHRRWTRRGLEQHHIIDPLTGQPAQTDLLSVTVIASDVMQAEAAAKAALILGSTRGMLWLDEHPLLAGLLVLEDSRVLTSKRMKTHW